MEQVEQFPHDGVSDVDAQILVDALGRFALAMMVTVHEQRDDMGNDAQAAFDRVILDWVATASEFLPVKEIAEQMFPGAA
jgi:hypothetical protein